MAHICEDGVCYYTDAWHKWGRWLFMGLLISFLVLLIPLAFYVMSRRRIRRGLLPISGTGWMFPNPYKGQQPLYPKVAPADLYPPYPADWNARMGANHPATPRFPPPDSSSPSYAQSNPSKDPSYKGKSRSNQGYPSRQGSQDASQDSYQSYGESDVTERGHDWEEGRPLPMPNAHYR